MDDHLCEYSDCKKVTERNRRFIVTYAGNSIYFCSAKCLTLFYLVILYQK